MYLPRFRVAQVRGLINAPDLRYSDSCRLYEDWASDFNLDDRRHEFYH